MLDESHVSNFERLNKFAINIWPPGLLSDSCSMGRPMSSKSRPIPFPLTHVSLLLAFVPAIMAIFACSRESCE